MTSSHPSTKLAGTGAAQRPIWEKYLTDYNEGLGLVYERFVLNDFLEDLRQRFHITSVLEAPIYGMAGVTGINSVMLARRGVHVTLVDDIPDRAEAVQRIWAELGLTPEMHVISPDGWGHLPFEDNQFDLTWNWAALWYLPDAAALLRELVRTSRHLVFVAMPNNIQVGYWMRKYLIDKDFFQTVDERWVDIERIRWTLRNEGAEIIASGVLDVPPWPDTVMPANEVLKRLGIRSAKLEDQFTGESWEWNTMAYYLGEQPDLYERVIKYAWLDHAPLPWQIKSVWAHHRWLLARVDG